MTPLSRRGALPSDVLWPAHRLGEAIAELGRRAGYAMHSSETVVAADPPDDTQLARWLEGTARSLGIDAEPVETPYADVLSMVRSAAPAIIRIPGSDVARFIVLSAGSRRRVTLLTPDLISLVVDAEDIRAALCVAAEEPVRRIVDHLLEETLTPRDRQGRTRRLLYRQLLVRESVGGCWLIRPAGTASLLTHLGGATFVRRIATMLSAQVVQYLLFMGAWWLIGWIALTDRLDRGWLLLWVLLWVTVMPLRLYTYLAAGRLSIDLSARLKRRLIDGAFDLDTNEIRRMGAGQLLGRTMDVEAIETFSFEGLLYLVMGVIQLAFAGLVLWLGAGGTAHVLLLAGWTLLTAIIAAAYRRERMRWTDTRVEVTNAVVEEIIGHRTRVVQESEERWGDRDDAALERYHTDSVRQNRFEVALETIVPRGWFAVGVAGLIPSFVAGGASGGALAAGIGGVLISYRAFEMIGRSLEQLVAALASWRQLAPLLARPERRESAGSPRLDIVARTENGGALDARGITFRHEGRRETVLHDVDLRVFSHDRILFEGPSGAGKSTLASLLATSRHTQTGVLLLDGLDPATVGHRRWRQRVVHVPQFHENHVFIGSFAFNVLMGRGWPPSGEDVREANAVCRALGLGALLDRMPGGLFEMVGETGWQLSHGERSRMFVARAMLQQPRVIILDESLSALDPSTLRGAIDYLFTSDAAIMLIAHP